MKSKRKIKELKENEKYFRYDWKSNIDGLEYWTKIAARNELESYEKFKEEYDVSRLKNIEVCLDK